MRIALLLLVLSLAGAGAESAQLAREAPRDGITVTSRATVRVPADGIRFEVNLSGSLGDADEDAVLSSLRAAGVESPQMIYPSIVSANSPTIVRGTLRNPTRERVEALGKAALSLLAAHPNLKLQTLGAAPFLDDCAKAEEQARRQAFDDARRRASAIAALAHVSAAQILSVTEISAPACAPSDGRPAGFVQNGIERDPAVYVAVTESVTFAIR